MRPELRVDHARARHGRQQRCGGSGGGQLNSNNFNQKRTAHAWRVARSGFGDVGQIPTAGLLSYAVVVARGTDDVPGYSNFHELYVRLDEYRLTIRNSATVQSDRLVTIFPSQRIEID